MSESRDRRPLPRAGDYLVCNGQRYLIRQVEGAPKARLLVEDHDGTVFILRAFRLENGAWSVERRDQQRRERPGRVAHADRHLRRRAA